MNIQGNLYTFMYSTILVVLVALLLSVAAISLKPHQEKNIRIEKMQAILKSVKIEVPIEQIEATYKKHIKNVYTVNIKGEKIKRDAFNIDLHKELSKKTNEINMPVYECTLDDGSKKIILELRGKGLWGPIWGFISLNDDRKTIYGIIFDHKSETPGLGAEISQVPFQKQFKGKQIFDRGGDFTGIFVLKAGGNSNNHSVDGISGGTITSIGVQNMMKNCLGNYETYLKELN